MDQERQSADALRAYAETLGRWPKVSEWNQYAKEHNLLLYPQISRKLKKNWKALKASSGMTTRFTISKNLNRRCLHWQRSWDTGPMWQSGMSTQKSTGTVHTEFYMSKREKGGKCTEKSLTNCSP